MSGTRLDQFLVENRYYPSRSRALDAIRRGTVRVNGAVAVKPAMSIHQSDRIDLTDQARGYVSRGALKLKAAMQATEFRATGLNVLDLGASTGGFTQILLEDGAKRVFALDCGHDQLAEKLLADRRVTNLEGVNARELTTEMLDGTRPQAITCDVSFISLKLALPPALRIAEAGAWGIFLVKPQFEAGPQAIGKGGIIRDPAIGKRVVDELAEWLDAQPNWRMTHFLDSPIHGADGNREFLLAGIKDR